MAKKQETSLEIKNYIEQIDPEKREDLEKIRRSILDNLPEGFEETIQFKMLGYVVPLSLFPDGYHCQPNTPLPFVNLAAQKNFIALYHMGLYADQQLLSWFEAEYPKHCKKKLDMGKSCIRFKKNSEIPLELIGALMRKMTPDEWIKLYSDKFLKKK